MSKKNSGVKKSKKQKPVESDSEVEDTPLRMPSSSSDSDDAPSNVILRSKIDKKLLNNANKKKLEFSDSDSDDNEVKITVNKDFEKRFEKKQTATALSKDNQRILSQLQRQVEREEREELRAERKAHKLAKMEEAAVLGKEYESEDDGWSSSADEYSSEDEVGKLITPELDNKIFETLVSLRKKDPKIYNKDVVFFEKESDSDSNSDSDSDSESKRASAEKKKAEKNKLTLGRFMAQQAEKGEAMEASDSDSDFETTQTESFQEEQDRIKREFFASLKEEESRSGLGKDSDSDDDDMFGKSKRVWDPTFEPDSDEEAELNAKKASEFAANLDGENVITGKGSSFLENYLMKGWWKETDKTQLPSATELLGKARSRAINLGEDVRAEDDDADDAADRFEAQYNFRFLEPGAEEISSHPRSHMIEDSLRKKDDSRRDTRLRKLERQKLERQQKLEEIKRLKNVKRQALTERVKAISLVAGISLGVDDDEELDEDMEKPDFGGESDEERELAAIKKQFEKKGKKSKASALSAQDLVGDFDPQEHDRLMAKLFNADFYNALGDDDVENEEEELRNDNAIELLEKVTAGSSDDEDDTSSKPSRSTKKPAEMTDENDDTSIPEGMVLPVELETDDSDLDDDERKERRDLRAKYIKQHKIVSTSIKRQRDNSAQTIKKSLQSMFETGNEKETESWWRQEKEKILSHTQIPEEFKNLSSKQKEAAIQALLAAEMEKLDELDKEDVLAGTRFRYRQVAPATFGMDIVDILNSDEKELNRRVNMKRLAPYRDDDMDVDWKVLQKQQRDVYKEFMQNNSTGKHQKSQHSISTSKYGTTAPAGYDDAMDLRKAFNHNKTAKGQYSQDISQGNRPWSKNKVTSVSWYNSKNNFTIPAVKKNKHIKFDNDNSADSLTKKVAGGESKKRKIEN